MSDDNTKILEQIKAFSAELSGLKAKIAGLDDTENEKDQVKSKDKLGKNRGAGTNDPNDEDEAGENDYDDDDINEEIDSKGSPKQVKSKDSPKQKPSGTIAGKLKQLQAELDTMRKAPVIDSILKAKSDLGLITNETREAESKKLSELPEATLKEMDAEFTQIASARRASPFVRYQSASVNTDGSRGKFADAFIKEAILNV